MAFTALYAILILILSGAFAIQGKIIKKVLTLLENLATHLRNVAFFM